MNPIPLTQYFRHARPEVLDVIPLSAERILDVGCGAGALGARLRARQNCEVWGIEPDPDAAAAARTVLNRVIEKPVGSCSDDLPGGHFDTLVVADVLEHLVDPWATLRTLARGLAPGATVVLSLPNLQYHAVVHDLARGRFTYVPAGILDHTHLRFFTRRSAIDLVRLAGMDIERIIPVYGARRDERAAQRHRIPNGFPADAAHRIEDLYIQQFLIVARAGDPPPDTSRVRVSIVMLTFNRLDMTRRALSSLRASTRQPYELIVVDNGSTDGTSTYLQEIEQQGGYVLRNPTNRGVAAGWNQGLRVAKGDCLMVLNNDIIVAGDWLERMTHAAHQVPRAGLVGCRTTKVGGPQALLPDYQDLRDFPLFARRYAALADGSWFELTRVVAVALLWRRHVYERVGSFDERFFPASFEDDDYSMRSIAAGFRNIVANDVFIHHEGSASHASNQILPTEVQSDNRRRFLEKWGAAAPDLIATGWADYDAHVALLDPSGYALPGWMRPEASPRGRAKHLAKIGRRLARQGWHTQARRAFHRSLGERFTLGGLSGLLWSYRPKHPLTLASELPVSPRGESV